MYFDKILSASWIAIVLMIILTLAGGYLGYSIAIGASTLLAIPIVLLAFMINFWLGYNCVMKFKFDDKDVIFAAAAVGIVNGLVTLIFELFRKPAPPLSFGTPDSSKIISILAFFIISGVVGTLLGIAISFVGAKIARGKSTNPASRKRDKPASS